MPRRIAWRESSPCITCLAIFFSILPKLYDQALFRGLALGSVLDNSQHVVLAQDQILFAIELDLRPGILAEENAIARLDVDRRAAAVFQQLPIPYRNHLALLRLLFRCVRYI